MTRYHTYAPKHVDFLTRNANGMKRVDLFNLFRSNFGLDVTDKSISGIMYRNGIKTNYRHSNTQFKKGQKAWNKGMKGLFLGDKDTQFKKGDIGNTRPIGSKVLSEDRNRWLIKVEEPNVWRFEHHVLWEKENGNIPKGHYVLFKDNDRDNVKIENLFISTVAATLSVFQRQERHHNPLINVAMHTLMEIKIKVNKMEARTKND